MSELKLYFVSKFRKIWNNLCPRNHKTQVNRGDKQGAEEGP